MDDITDDTLMQLFLRFINEFEADAVKKCLDGDESNIDEIIIPMLSRFNCMTRPKPGNFHDIILNTARYALVHQPYFTLQKIRGE